VKIAVDQWGTGTYEIAQNIQQPHEAHLLRLFITKSKAVLGWEPHFKSKEAIAYTIDWYKNYEKDPAAYTLLQIKNFLSKL
jgi:CDP-glucose 4,6-dehydratase